MYFFEISGPAFLFWYIAFFSVSVLASFVAQKTLLHVSEDRIPDGEIDQYDIAFLNGGIEQVYFSAIGTLAQLGIVEVDQESRTLKLNESAMTTKLHFVEENLCTTLKWAKDETIDKVYDRFKPIGSKLRRSLENMNLVVSEEREIALRMLPAFILLLVPVTLGIPRLFIGMSHHKPVMFLFLLLFVSGITAIWAAVAAPICTNLGTEALAKLKQAHTTLRLNFASSPSTLGSSDVRLAYALFGGVVGGMTISALDPFNQAKAAMRPPASSSCGSGSSSCGGGGGCGGGCGGCGG